jgi:hypothetical protein
MNDEQLNPTDAAEEQAPLDGEASSEHIDSAPDRPVSEDLPPAKYIEERNEQVEGKKHGFQKRVDRLTADKYQLRNQNEELRSRLDLIEARLTPVERTGVDPDNSEAPEEGRQANGSENGHYQEDERERTIRFRFEERIGKLTESRPELWEKSAGVHIHEALLNVIRPAIVELDNGHEVTAHLIDNPTEVQKLHSMSPSAAIAYIGKISARLEAPKERIRSKAEAPIQPVGGTARSTVPMEDLPPREYQRLRNAQEAKRNGGYR